MFYLVYDPVVSICIDDVLSVGVPAWISDLDMRKAGSRITVPRLVLSRVKINRLFNDYISSGPHNISSNILQSRRLPRIISPLSGTRLGSNDRAE